MTLEDLKEHFTAHFSEKNVPDEIVELVFSEIDTKSQGFITGKDFWDWKDQLQLQQMRTWSHTV